MNRRVTTSKFGNKALISAVILVLIFSTGLGLFTTGRLSGTSSPVAYASTDAGMSIYLPLVTANTLNHVTFNSFGVDLGAIRESNGLTEMQAAGSYWVRRVGIDWEAVEPNPGERNWSALAGLETGLKNASERGMEVMIAIKKAPQWARTDATYTCSSVKSEYFDELGDFVYDVVSRYRGEPYNVKYWELWNEPDIAPELLADNIDSQFGCWGNDDDAYYGGGYYAEMLKAVYPRINAANPKAQVMVGGLNLDCNPYISDGCKTEQSKKPPMFLEGILRHNGANDGGNYFDGVSYHAYDYYAGQLGQYGNSNFNAYWNSGGPVSRAKADFIQDLLADFGTSGKILMNTEAALLCGGGLVCDSSPTSDFELTKAYYLAETFAAGKAIGLEASVWFTVFGWRDSGLLYTDLSPRPAYISFKVARMALQDVSFSKRLSINGVYGYEFKNSRVTRWLLWSQDGDSHSVHFIQNPDKIYNVFGDYIPVSNQIDIDVEPVWVEWSQ